MEEWLRTNTSVKGRLLGLIGLVCALLVTSEIFIDYSMRSTLEKSGEAGLEVLIERTYRESIERALVKGDWDEANNILRDLRSLDVIESALIVDAWGADGRNEFLVLQPARAVYSLRGTNGKSLMIEFDRGGMRGWFGVAKDRYQWLKVLLVLVFAPVFWVVGKSIANGYGAWVKDVRAFAEGHLDADFSKSSIFADEFANAAEMVRRIHKKRIEESERVLRGNAKFSALQETLELRQKNINQDVHDLVVANNSLDYNLAIAREEVNNICAKVKECTLLMIPKINFALMLIDDGKNGRALSSETYSDISKSLYEIKNVASELEEEILPSNDVSDSIVMRCEALDFVEYLRWINKNLESQTFEWGMKYSHDTVLDESYVFNADQRFLTKLLLLIFREAYVSGSRSIETKTRVMERSNHYSVTCEVVTDRIPPTHELQYMQAINYGRDLGNVGKKSERMVLWESIIPIVKRMAGSVIFNNIENEGRFGYEVKLKFESASQYKPEEFWEPWCCLFVNEDVKGPQRNILQKFVEDKGGSVEHLQTLEGAIKTSEERHHKIIVMSADKGVEAVGLRKVRMAKHGRSAYLVAMLKDNSTQAVELALNMGFDDVISSRMEPSELESMIDGCERQQRLNRRNAKLRVVS